MTFDQWMRDKNPKYRPSDDAVALRLLRECWSDARASMLAGAPAAIMDTRDVLGICAATGEDFPALYALQGRRVRLVPENDWTPVNPAQPHRASPTAARATARARRRR